MKTTLASYLHYQKPFHSTEAEIGQTKINYSNTSGVATLEFKAAPDVIRQCRLRHCCGDLFLINLNNSHIDKWSSLIQ